MRVERDVLGFAYDSADVGRAADGAGVDEVVHVECAARSVKRADDAPDVGRARYVRGVRYVFYRRVSAHAARYRADVFVAGYRAAVERDVADYRIAADAAEEADVFLAPSIYRKAEYVVAEAVEPAFESVVCGANRSEAAASCSTKASILAARRVVRVYRVAEGEPAVDVVAHRLKLEDVFDPHVAADAVGNRRVAVI